MRVYAKDIVAAWVDYTKTAPYHTENHPIGRDRKKVEGPQPTNEEFGSTWLPTAPQRSIHAAADDPLPGVPRALYLAWQAAHMAAAVHLADGTYLTLKEMTDDAIKFISLAVKLGFSENTHWLKVLPQYAEKVARGKERFTNDDVFDQISWVDHAINLVHQEVLDKTGTQRDQWYAVDLKKTAPAPTQPAPTQNLTPAPQPQPQQQPGPKPDRGLGAPFLDDMWQRTKRRETKGMRIRKEEAKLSMRIEAADVVPFDPSKRRLKTPSAAPKSTNVAPEQWEDLPEFPDPYGEDTGHEENYESLLYMYDNTSSELEEMARNMIQLQPSLPPDQQKEIGALIANLKQAIRVLTSHKPRLR